MEVCLRATAAEQLPQIHPNVREHLERVDVVRQHQAAALPVQVHAVAQFEPVRVHPTPLRV